VISEKDARLGVLFALGSFVIWGVSPLFFALVNHVPAFEVMAHRILWSLPVIAIYAALTGRWTRFVQTAREGRTMLSLGLATAFIAVNWFIFIYAIQIGQTAQASFGYYIYPIVAVMLGAMVFREHITPLQWSAAAVATVGVALIAVERGALPWIALVVAATFSVYGVIRKRVTVGPLVGVLWELTLASGPLAAYLWFFGSGAFSQDAQTALLLIGCSVFTGIPLVMYVEAAKRLKFSTVGVLFYINPTLQFVSALILGEALNLAVLAAFGVIWLGVALYCYDLTRR
jgi:chloramphenicol-sensitive protein RarD